MDCCQLTIDLPGLSRKPIALDFAGGDLSSDAGLLPLALAAVGIFLGYRFILLLITLYTT